MNIYIHMLEIPDVKLKKTDTGYDRYWVVVGNIAIMGSLEELNSLGFQIETLTRRELKWKRIKGGEKLEKSTVFPGPATRGYQCGEEGQNREADQAEDNREDRGKVSSQDLKQGG